MSVPERTNPERQPVTRRTWLQSFGGLLAPKENICQMGLAVKEAAPIKKHMEEIRAEIAAIDALPRKERRAKGRDRQELSAGLRSLREEVKILDREIVWRCGAVVIEILAALGTLGTVGYFTRKKMKEHEEKRTAPVRFRKTVACLREDVLNQQGKPVSPEANLDGCEQYVAYWKQFHGGESLVARLQKHPPMADAFLEHHQQLFATMVRCFERVGSEKFRCFVEGLQSNAMTAEHPEQEEMLDSIAVMNRMLRDPATKDIALRSTRKLMLTGDPRTAVGAMQSVNAGFRFAAHCREKGYRDIVFGTNPPGHRPIHVALSERLRALARADHVSDAAIGEFISWFRQEEERNDRIVHDYLADMVREHIPPSGVGFILLGGSHSRHGAGYSIEQPAAYPLEKSIGNRAPQTGVETWEQQDYVSILQMCEGPHVLALGSRDMTVETVRLLLDRMRTDGSSIAP